MRILLTLATPFLSFAAAASADGQTAAKEVAAESDGGARLATYERSGKIGFVNARGRRVTPAKYDQLRSVRHGIHVVMADGKRCAVNMAGEEFMPCIYDFIVFPDDKRVTVRLRGEIFDVDSRGQRIGQPASLPAPRRAASTTTASSAQAPAYNRVKALADARQWDNALRAALGSTAQDKIYVLLKFRGSSTNDMQRWPGQKVVLDSMHIFDDAIAAATPDQQRQLASMKQSFEDYIRKQGRPLLPASNARGSGSSSASPAPSVRTQAPRRCYQTSGTHQTCFD